MSTFFAFKKHIARNFIPKLIICGAVLHGHRRIDSYWWLILDSKEYLQGYTIHYLDSGIDTGNILLSN
jgi:hypothetical protein